MKNLLKNFTERCRHLFARTGERVSLSPLLMSILNRREQQNDLPWLTPERAVELYEDYRAGNYAEIQLVWEQLEDYDETLFTVLAKRQRTLAAMPWQVAIDAAAVGDDPVKQQLAEAQQELLNKALLAVENLEEALVHLGMADFRGVAALEITGNATRQRWEVIEPWNLARPSRRGPWLYNAQADPSYTSLETLDATRCIIREERPIDLPVMFLIVDKMHAIKGWDTFLDVFGSPSIFLELPPATSEQKALEYDKRVQQIVSDGRGTIPSGSKFQTVETHADNSQSFEARAKWCREAIITIATGGLLTVEAQSGSGTLAGNAHADSFEELVSGTAATISNVINVQWARPLLQIAFPGQRIYAYFTMAAEPADDRAAQAQIIATLAGAGYKADAEAVSEMAGFEVREVEQPPMMPGGMMTNRAPLPAPQDDPPLSEAELAAFSSLATPNLDRMAQRQREVEAALRAAADLPGTESAPIKNSESDSEDCRAKDPSKCRVHGKNDRQEREMERSSMESAGYSKEEIERVLGKEPRQRMTDAQAADMAAFKKERKNIKESIKESLPKHGGLELKMDEPELKGTVLTRNAIGEMLADHAVRASVLNGCPTSAHVEAASRAAELASTAKKVGEEPGTKEKDKVEKITHLEKTFTAKDGNEYIAHFTAHHPKPNPKQPNKPADPPKLYFLYLRK